MNLFARIALAALTIAGCAHAQIHAPASERSAPGQLSYTLPSGGTVDVAVVAYDRIERDAVDATSYPALHVRLTLRNASAEPWSVDPREQLAQLADYGTLLPAAVSRRTLVVAPGETRTLDLFYPTPTAEFAQHAPGRIALDWRVRLPGGLVGDRARLDRELASITPPRP
jgi:hypothetical protein